MLIFDCFFGRCEKPSFDGCGLVPVRNLRRALKSRSMNKKDDSFVEPDESWKKAVDATLAAKAPTASKASAKRKKRLLVPREEIPWFPIIKPELCNGCGDCKVLCKPGVFELGEPDPTGIHRPKLIVAHPMNCLVLCDRCVPICTSGAIVLPKKEEFEKYVEYLD
jgi:NAD-dependent dihydropyrimidine dehydrogenase PreA subunit